MKPRVTSHVGVSVDGRLDWLSEQMWLYYDLAAKLGADAMMSGSGTILAAYPDSDDTPIESTSMDSDLELIVVDSRGRIRNWRRIQSEPWWGNCIVICSETTPAAYIEYVRDVGVSQIIAGEDRVDLAAALEQLRVRFGIEHLRIDSGGILNGELLRAGLVDEVSVLIEPRLVGGTSPKSFFTAPDLGSRQETIPLELLHVEQMAEGFVWLRYAVKSRNESGTIEECAPEPASA